MNLSFKAVTEYVKNLFPGKAPVQVSDNRELDIRVLAVLSTDKFYTIANNGHRYWYYFTDKPNIPVAQYILRSNGVEVKQHKSMYFYSRPDVLRIRRKDLDKNIVAANFVDALMCVDTTSVDIKQIHARIDQIKQKTK